MDEIELGEYDWTEYIDCEICTGDGFHYACPECAEKHSGLLDGIIPQEVVRWASRKKQ